MSRKNVGALRAVYEEWGEGNFRAGADLYDERVMFIPFSDFPAADHYVGPDGVREFMLAFLSAWTNLSIAADDFIPVGDHVLVSAHWKGVGQESGAATEMRCFDVWTFRGKTVTRVEFFVDRAEALEALGVSE